MGERGREGASARLPSDRWRPQVPAARARERRRRAADGAEEGMGERRQLSRGVRRRSGRCAAADAVFAARVTHRVHQMRSALDHRVMDGDGGGNPRVAAGRRSAEGEQADDIAAVGVETEVVVRLLSRQGCLAGHLRTDEALRGVRRDAPGGWQLVREIGARSPGWLPGRRRLAWSHQRHAEATRFRAQAR